MLDPIADDCTPYARWSGEYRAHVAQRRKLMRFLLESAFFESRTLQGDWKALTGENVNTIQEAQRAGFRGRPWLTGHHQRLTLPPPPKPKPLPTPRPGVNLTDIAAVLGITRERVRQHAERPCFPQPIPSTVGARHRRWFRADIERYYRECGEVFTAYRAAGAVSRRGQILKSPPTNHDRKNGRIKFTLGIPNPDRPGKRREFRIDIPNDTTRDDLAGLMTEIESRLLTPSAIGAPS